MHLGRARVEQHRDDLARRVAADDRVVDDHEPLAGDLGERVELHPDALLAQPLVRLDERAPDVAVLDQPLAVRDPGGAREADRRRRARVGDRHHEVGVDGRLGGEPLAHPHAHAVHLGRPRASSRAGRSRRARRCRAPAGPRAAPASRAGRPRRSRRARRAGPRARTRRRSRSSAHVSEASTQSLAEAAERRAAGSRAGRGSRRASPPTSGDDRVGALEPAPSRARRPPEAAPGRARSARRSPRCRRWRRARCRRRRARRAARPCSSRLPLWPSATVRARPWWTSGCAFAQSVEPVVE